MGLRDATIDRERRDLVTHQVMDESRLIRFVAAPDGSVAPDLARKLPGRGLWVAADRASIQAAVKKNLFSRAAKAPLKPAADLADTVESLLVRRCLDQLGLARREGEECARLSRAVSEVFDAADPIAGEYLLEVSSPGVDRPLTRQSDFDLFEGYEARLETDRMVEGRKRFKGILAGTDGENIAIDLDGEEDTALIPFDWLVDAKLVLTDELMKAGAEKRAARNDNDTTETED